MPNVSLTDKLKELIDNVADNKNEWRIVNK